MDSGISPGGSVALAGHGGAGLAGAEPDAGHAADGHTLGGEVQLAAEHIDALQVANVPATAQCPGLLGGQPGAGWR